MDQLFDRPVSEAVIYLRSLEAIRELCQHLFDLAMADQLTHFRCDLSKLDRNADYVLQVIKTNYPDLQVPFHSRWRHFGTGGNQRLDLLETKLAGLSPLERARTKFDLVITSVLLDAGAGAEWQYQEPGTNAVWRRSEGLGIASFYTFLQGGFSSDPDQPLQADAQGLQNFSAQILEENFQVTSDNPLVGVVGRVELLQKLGETLAKSPQMFSLDGVNFRLGYLVDYLLGDRRTTPANYQLPAAKVFQAVLYGLGDIWANRIVLDGVNLGDVWQHSQLAGETPESKLVPFHKLSQWLTYSLLEPLQELGIEITHLEAMTGLPEYRNGGLCLDLGLLQPKYPEILTQTYSPDAEVIVEWRALTVILLDRMTETIRQKLNLSPTDLPLVKILEGGTWTAGRKIAAELRPGGIPPLKIASDGTVF